MTRLQMSSKMLKHKAKNHSSSSSCSTIHDATHILKTTLRKQNRLVLPERSNGGDGQRGAQDEAQGELQAILAPDGLVPPGFHPVLLQLLGLLHGQNPDRDVTFFVARAGAWLRLDACLSATEIAEVVFGNDPVN